MPADHVDPADDARISAAPGPPDARPPLPNQADREAASHIHRAQVDRVNATTAWADHKATYPERARLSAQTHPDDSWSSGERHLTPDQNTEATKACADIHDEGERVILPAMRRIEASDPSRQLAGLQHMLKGVDRLKEKVADVLLVESHLTPRQALGKVPDVVRYTLVYEHEHYADGVLADIDRLKASGFEEIKLKNLWSSDLYKGVNSQWRRPDTGLRFEVQFHTAESLEVKELTHGAYERLRNPETTQAERNKLEEFQRRANALLVVPPGTDRIEDFPERKR